MSRLALFNIFTFCASVILSTLIAMMISSNQLFWPDIDTIEFLRLRPYQDTTLAAHRSCESACNSDPASGVHGTYVCNDTDKLDEIGAVFNNSGSAPPQLVEYLKKCDSYVSTFSTETTLVCLCEFIPAA